MNNFFYFLFYHDTTGHVSVTFPFPVSVDFLFLFVIATFILPRPYTLDARARLPISHFKFSLKKAATRE